MAHNIPTSVSLRGWGSPSLHRWTCAAVLPEVTPGCYFPLPSFGPGSLWGLFAVISQPLKWISSSDYFGHTGGPCGYRGTLGPEVWKGFLHYEAVLLLVIMGWGSKRGEWEEALNTHSFLLVLYLPSLCFPITYLLLILSLWVPLFVSGQSETKHKNVALGQARA